MTEEARMLGEVLLRALHKHDYDWNAAAKSLRSELSEDEIWDRIVEPLIVTAMKEIVRESGLLSEDLPSSH